LSTTTKYRVCLDTPEGTRIVFVRRDQTIWDAAQAKGISLPAICHQGRCLTCAGKLIGPGKIDQSRAESYFPEDRAEGFVLLCTAEPRSELRIRTHQENQMRRHRLKRGLPAPYA
jgi:ferredoxin